MEYVKLPPSVRKIGDFAFRDCFQLARVAFVASMPAADVNHDEKFNSDSLLEEIGQRSVEDDTTS